jgi:hypothetical protein
MIPNGLKLIVKIAKDQTSPEVDKKNTRLALSSITLSSDKCWHHCVADLDGVKYSSFFFLDTVVLLSGKEFCATEHSSRKCPGLEEWLNW